MNSSEDRRSWNTLDVVFGLAALLAGVFVLQYLGLGASAGSPALNNALVMGVTYLYIFFVVCVFTVVKYGSSFAELGFCKTPGKALGLAVVLWFAVRAVIFLYSLAATGIASLYGAKPPAELTNQVSDLFGPGIKGFLLAVIVAVIIGPLVEEIFFRGFIYPAFKRRLGVWPAIITSSVIFGVFHVNPWLMFPTALMGVAMAWLYERNGSLAAPVFFHGLNNLVSVVIVYTLVGK